MVLSLTLSINILIDEGSNNSGLYDLRAVLTHKGRSSSSGHYVAWVKRSEDDWVMFDDDNVHGVKYDNIKELSGGGKFVPDGHTPYNKYIYYIIINLPFTQRLRRSRTGHISPIFRHSLLENNTNCKTSFKFTF